MAVIGVREEKAHRAAVAVAGVRGRQKLAAQQRRATPVAPVLLVARMLAVAVAVQARQEVMRQVRRVAPEARA